MHKIDMLINSSFILLPPKSLAILGKFLARNMLKELQVRNPSPLILFAICCYWKLDSYCYSTCMCFRLWWYIVTKKGMNRHNGMFFLCSNREEGSKNLRYHKGYFDFR